MKSSTPRRARAVVWSCISSQVALKNGAFRPIHSVKTGNAAADRELILQKVRWKSVEILSALYRLNDTNLALRRDFMRIAAPDMRVLARLHPWAQKVAPALVKEFYDHQFTFGPTRTYFTQYAGRKQLPLEHLRQQLEHRQARVLHPDLRRGGHRRPVRPRLFRETSACGANAQRDRSAAQVVHRQLRAVLRPDTPVAPPPLSAPPRFPRAGRAGHLHRVQL